MAVNIFVKIVTLFTVLTMCSSDMLASPSELTASSYKVKEIINLVTNNPTFLAKLRTLYYDGHPENQTIIFTVQLLVESPKLSENISQILHGLDTIESFSILSKALRSVMENNTTKGLLGLASPSGNLTTNGNMILTSPNDNVTTDSNSSNFKLALHSSNLTRDNTTSDSSTLASSTGNLTRDNTTIESSTLASSSGNVTRDNTSSHLRLASPSGNSTWGNTTDVYLGLVTLCGNLTGGNTTNQYLRLASICDILTRDNTNDSYLGLTLLCKNLTVENTTSVCLELESLCVNLSKDNTTDGYLGLAKLCENQTRSNGSKTSGSTFSKLSTNVSSLALGEMDAFIRELMSDSDVAAIVKDILNSNFDEEDSIESRDEDYKNSFRSQFLNMSPKSEKLIKDVMHILRDNWNLLQKLAITIYKFVT